MIEKAVLTIRSYSFAGSKLRLARTFCGLTQAALADEVACTHPVISQLEAGLKQPSELMLNALGVALGFEPQFFFEPLLDEFRDEECNFRRRTTTPVTTRNRVLAHGTLSQMLFDYFAKSLRWPAMNVPTYRVATRDTIEQVAEKCRIHWGLGHDLPIRSMCRTLEWAGVVVTRFAANAVKIDAFSRPGKRHVVVLNTDKGSASRARFDMAHELGHLVMHGGLEPDAPDLEPQADMFASAFLLPRAGFIRGFPAMRVLNWDIIFRLKREWGASAAAIVRRAYDLKLIDALNYQRAYKFIHARGWHKGEPDEPEPEHPELVPGSLAKLGQLKGLTFYDVAKQLYWRPGTLARIAGVPLPAQEEPSPGQSENVVILASFRKVQ